LRGFILSRKTAKQPSARPTFDRTTKNRNIQKSTKVFSDGEEKNWVASLFFFGGGGASLVWPIHSKPFSPN